MAKLDKDKPRGKGTPSAAQPSSSSKGKQRQQDEAEEIADAVDDAAAAAPPPPPPPSIDLDKVAKKMHHSLRQIHAAAKRSRQFEIQRLIKRSKATKAASSSDPPLESQLNDIKSMDLDDLASSALLSKLAKAKLLPKGEAADALKTGEAMEHKLGVGEWPLLHGIWEDEALRQAWASTRTGNLGSFEEAKAKARAKLLSHRVLAEETAKAVEALGKLVGRAQDQPSAANGAEATPNTNTNGEISAAPKAKAAKSTDESVREWSGSEDEDEEEDEEAADSPSGDEDDNDDEDLDEEAIQERVAQLGDLDQWDHLIGGSDDEGEVDDDEEGSEEGGSNESDEGITTIAASTRSSGDAKKKRKRSASPEAQRKGKKKVAIAAPPTASPSDTDASDENDDDDEQASDAESEASFSSSSSSRYLPSLSHGFVTQSLRTRDDDFSGSEDEGDFEEDVEDHLPTGKGTKASSGKEKKNRMGQRARKALWEKKYGKNANHVKLREKEKRGKEGVPAPFKPLRRGRNGQVLDEFVEPEKKDSGWKRFPVKEEAAPAKVSASSSSTRAAASPAGRGGHRGAAPASRPPRQQQQQRPPPSSSHRPRGAPPASAASDAAAMHPSWVAKQKQKEKEEAIARSLAGGGGGASKKVVFD